MVQHVHHTPTLPILFEFELWCTCLEYALLGSIRIV